MWPGGGSASIAPGSLFLGAEEDLKLSHRADTEVRAEKLDPQGDRAGRRSECNPVVVRPRPGARDTGNDLPIARLARRGRHRRFRHESNCQRHRHQSCRDRLPHRHLLLWGGKHMTRSGVLPYTAQRTSLPPCTHTVCPMATVASVKKFHRTYPPPTAPPSSVLSPSERRITPAP